MTCLDFRPLQDRGLPAAAFLEQVAGGNQLANAAFDRTLAAAHFAGDGADAGPTFAKLVGMRADATRGRLGGIAQGRVSGDGNGKNAEATTVRHSA